MSHEHSFGSRPKGKAQETVGTKGDSEICNPLDALDAGFFVPGEARSERRKECMNEYMTD